MNMTHVVLCEFRKCFFLSVRAKTANTLCWLSTENHRNVWRQTNNQHNRYRRPSERNTNHNIQYLSRCCFRLWFTSSFFLGPCWQKLEQNVQFFTDDETSVEIVLTLLRRELETFYEPSLRWLLLDSVENGWWCNKHNFMLVFVEIFFICGCSLTFQVTPETKQNRSQRFPSCGQSLLVHSRICVECKMQQQIVKIAYWTIDSLKIR